MKTGLTIALLLALSVSPAHSQDRDEDDLKKAVNGALENAKKNPLKEKAATRAALEAALKETLKHMNTIEHGGVGKGVADYIQDEKNSLSLAFRTQGSTTTLEFGHDGGTTICLSDALPPYPRVLAPHLVGRAASLSLSEMPWGAEREYMILSLEVRAWLELGGDKEALPVIEPLAGYKDEELSGKFKLWLENKPEAAVEALAKASVMKTLTARLVGVEEQLKRSNLSHAYRLTLENEKAELEDAQNNRFPEFLKAEKMWRSYFEKISSARHPGPREWKGVCGVDKPSHRLIASPEEWEKLWKDIGELAPPADFRKNFALVVFLGTRPSSGFRVVFSDPVAGQSATIVRYKIEAPSNAAADALTQPYAVKLFPKTAQAIRVESSSD